MLKAAQAEEIGRTASGGDLTALQRHMAALSIKGAAHRLAPTTFGGP